MGKIGCCNFNCWVKMQRKSSDNLIQSGFRVYRNSYIFKSDNLKWLKRELLLWKNKINSKFD